MTTATHDSDLGGAAAMTPTTLRIATVHDECHLALKLALLDAIEQVVRDFGVDHVWIDPASVDDLVVLAEPRC